MTQFFVSVLCFVFAASFVDAAKNSENSISTSTKLSEEVENREWDQQQDLFFIPTHFEIETRFIFGGSNSNIGNQNKIQSKVKILGQTQANSKWLALHALGLNFNTSTIQVTSQSGPLAFKEIDHEFTELYSRVLIYFETEIAGATPLEISMEYNANPDKWLHVKDSENKTELLVNVLQNNHRDYASACSTMFPCFGAGVKSTFNLTIIREMEYKSVTNGDLVSNSPDSKIDGYEVERYSWPTEIPPTMLTFAIFSKKLSNVDRQFGNDNKIVRVYAPKEDIRKGIFEHTAYYTSQILTFYEEYFGTSARVPKLEIFFIPGQSIKFESWGINVYGYSTDEGINLIPTAKAEKTNAHMIQHITQGLAKQWVGSWWDPEGEFILSESYPRYIEYLGLEVADNALSDYAIYIDLLETESLDKLSAKSQLESSNKGALLIRSFEGILNRDGVRRAVRLFLKHLWGQNVDTDYLDLNEMVAGNYTWSDIVKVLVGFMEKDGVPLVKLSVANQTHFALTQETYRKVEPEIKEEDGDSELWLLPVTHTQDSHGSEQNITWLYPHENVTFVVGNTDEIFLINPSATGYHRTFYEDPILLHRIQTQLELNHGTFRPLARARLITDYFGYAEQNYSSYSAALNLTTFLKKEDSLVVWTAFLDKFTKIYSRFLSHPQYYKLEDYLLPKVDYMLEQIDEPSKFEEELLREKLLFVSCRLERRNKRLFKPPYCQTYSQKLYREWATNPNGVNPLDSVFPKTLRPILECAIVAFGGMEAFNFMYEKYHNMRLEKESYLGTLSSLACAQETDVLEYLLQKTLQPTSSMGFAERDAWYVLNYLIDTPLPFGRAKILPFLTKNFDEVVEKIGGGYSSIIPQLLRYLSEYLSTSEQRIEVENFVNMHKDKLMNSTDTSTHLNQAFEAMDGNIQWMNTYGQDILSWMDQQ